ncbi:MAG: hypothetical protein DRP74_04225 [Candidatus Omnitrophota bacterium]|nr:MAG: hypothetical protein DRP74_04225 [Candidatus Omnitrophota bacterium]
MFWESFKAASIAVAQIFFLGLIGYFLIRRKFLDQGGLKALSRLVIEITLPVLIFYRLMNKFSFSLYPNWWAFPLISLIVTLAGLVVGFIFSGFINGRQRKLQFLNLTGFQNSGYLPLVLVVSLVSPEDLDTIFIYIFLFLLGFNLVIWSLGAHLLSVGEHKKFELGSLFTPTVIANLLSLLIIFFGLNKFLPQALFKPLKLVGECTFPLAMFVVGGNLALINLGKIDKKAMILLVLAKLIVLPLLGLVLVLKLKMPQLMGLLILIQLAMPPATSLSLIIRHYKKEDLLISQGIFFGHLISLITIPLFLSLYFTLSAIE